MHGRVFFFFFQAEDGIRDAQESRGLGDVYKRQASGALSIIGGGDTGLAVERAGVSEKISYISTGGGAFLELLEGKTMPAIEALEKNGGNT